MAIIPPFGETMMQLSYDLCRVGGQMGEYVLFGSTPLIMRGILEREPRDVDVFVTRRVWGSLLPSEDDWEVLTPDAGNPPILASKHTPLDVHLFFDWRDLACEMDPKALIASAENVKSWRCVSVLECLRVKKDALGAGADKHRADIEAIYDYLARSA